MYWKNTFLQFHPRFSYFPELPGQCSRVRNGVDSNIRCSHIYDEMLQSIAKWVILEYYCEHYNQFS